MLVKGGPGGKTSYHQANRSSRHMFPLQGLPGAATEQGDVESNTGFREKLNRCFAIKHDTPASEKTQIDNMITWALTAHTHSQITHEFGPANIFNFCMQAAYIGKWYVNVWHLKVCVQRIAIHVLHVLCIFSIMTWKVFPHYWALVPGNHRLS